MFRKGLRRIIVLACFFLLIYFLWLKNQPFLTHDSRHPAERHQDHGRPEQDRREQGARGGRPQRHERSAPNSPDDSGSTAEIACLSDYFSDWEAPSPATCTAGLRNGFPVPDQRCTPGGVNAAVTAAMLQDGTFRTRSVRNCATSEAQKHIAYRWYNLQKPRINSNQNQVCELDHLVPLELGGADGLGNIWPQCGPDAVALNDRYFKHKDRVENYLAAQVREGRLPLGAAQRGIASDWTQYLGPAEQWCQAHHRC